jgi:hypothetical protein
MLMPKVEISIRGIGTREEVAQLLEKPDSGLSLVGENLQRGFREPLHSSFGEVAVFVGLVLNVAKFAETIYQLLQTKKASRKPARRRKRVDVCILTPKGTKLYLRGSADEIESLLKKEFVDGE